MEATLPKCLYCREPIDPHQRVVVIDHGGERETQLGVEPELAHRTQMLFVHSRCAPAGWSAKS